LNFSGIVKAAVACNKIDGRIALALYQAMGADDDTVINLPLAPRTMARPVAPSSRAPYTVTD
jgi:hypothetical protein